MSQTIAPAPARAYPWAWLAPPASHLARYRDAGVWQDETIATRARAWAERAPDAPVFLGDPAAPTYASLLGDAEALAVSFGDLGLETGDVVSFQTPNWYEAAVINLACALAGLVVNPIVIIYRDAEVRHMMADSRSRLLFVAETFRGTDFAAMAERLRPDLPDMDHLATVRGTRGGLGYEELVAAGRGRTLAAPRVDPDAVKMLLYTSGTTGKPKGVLHSHNTLARAVQPGMRHWGVQPGDAILMPSPVTHISGYSNGLELPFLIGTRTVLMESWNADEALDLIVRHDVVGTVAATPFLQELALKAHAAGTDLPSLRYFACGGAAVPPEVVRSANAALAQAPAFRVYGSSEVPLVTLGWPADGELAATTDGEIVDYDVRFLDDAGNDVAAGEEGEIVARGPAMFMGYASEAQTREALTDDGYFRTGDLGRLTPERALLITGRKKDLIIRGGENISAKEIEDVLHLHPAIAEAAVVSMPHDRLGEGICAFLIVRGETPPDFAAVGAFVGQHGLAKQKRPERIEIVADFPRTASGKVRKDQLRLQIKALVEAEG
ncbi:AMP-binding protein [Sphingomonas profundi]|uniref:AMP-binding protein n=1 Tax=Alterirhizorhabdus profundi TaxID=2681549 RepID=UPI0012E8D959|nr:AMP-binding protein [Sphingomonas profundi]